MNFVNETCISQSQPCHWRNLKGVSKRDVSNQTIPIEDDSEKKDNNLSDNVSLFQSLRVLQEGEGEDDLNEEALSELLKLFTNKRMSNN